MNRAHRIMKSGRERLENHAGEEDEEDAREDSIWIKREDLVQNNRNQRDHVAFDLGEMPLNVVELQQGDGLVQGGRRKGAGGGGGAGSPARRTNTNHITKDTLYNSEHRSVSPLLLDSPKSELSDSERLAMDHRQQRESLIMAQIRLRYRGKKQTGFKDVRDMEDQEEIDPGDDKSSFFAKVSAFYLSNNH